MPPKRKAKDLGAEEQVEPPRRSSRRTTSTSTKEKLASEEPSSKPGPARKKVESESKTVVKKDVKTEEGGEGEGEGEEKNEAKSKQKSNKKSKSAKTITTTAPPSKSKPAPTEPPPTGRQYWLLKAEPESRIEKGKDIKFSIDDLAAKTEPEPWDGIRNFAARNNLRAMKKGDLAFFYHSSCKVPAIVGTMEIVEEHSPDLTAHDPSAPYYDASSSPTDPKWSVVHVVFRQKLQTPITLQELRAWHAETGGPLAAMQMLRLTRMSVSRVSAGEWRFLVSEMEKRGDVIREE